jgi:hypothetical protein
MEIPAHLECDADRGGSSASRAYSLQESAMKTMLWGCLVVVIGAGPIPGLEAQLPADARLTGISVGAGLDRFIYEGTAATAFTYRRSDLRPGRLGPELSVSLFPQALIARALLFAPDLGAAYNMSLPRSTLLIKAGTSALIGLNTDIVFVPGAHLGAGIVLRIDERTGIRIDATRHYYFDTGETEAIWSLGFALASLPLAAP